MSSKIRYAIRQIPDLGYYIVKYRGSSIEPESIEPAENQILPVEDLCALGVKEFTLEECAIHTIGRMEITSSIYRSGGAPNET